MKKIYLIGIGPGDSEYLTLKAINTIKNTDVFFLFEKEGREELLTIREEIIKKYGKNGRYRIVTAKIPTRNKNANLTLYKKEVQRWRDKKAEIITSLLKNEMKDNEIGSFLIFGDPLLYDGTLQIIQHIKKQNTIDFDYEIIPGITSIQVLAQKHKIPLNQIGEPIIITPARKLKEYPSDIKIENMVVMLDSSASFESIQDKDIHIYWGAYLGTEDELLVSGKLNAISQDLKKIITEAKKEKGWIMDIYILRKKEALEDYNYE